jgi:hypothetical protein
MDSVAQIALARRDRIVSVADTARARSLRVWRQMDFKNLDASWYAIAPTISQQVSAAQLVLANESDRFTNAITRASGAQQPRGEIQSQAFAGVDGAGRDLSGTLEGAVTTTKTAIGSGLGATESLQAGASYLAAIVKTLIADASRSADLVAAASSSYTYYVRVVGGSACSRCAILAGIRSGSEAFARHASCQCSAAAVTETRKEGDRYSTYDKSAIKDGLFDGPSEYFDALSAVEQDRIFTKAGAQAIRDGADINKVVNARRGANGIGYSSARGGATKVPAPRGRFQKTTIGVRADGSVVRVYTTAESATIRGGFGKAQRDFSANQILRGARYASTGRIRLMPESIIEICGDNLPLRQAFLRDAGYISYIPSHGYDNQGKWMQELADQKHEDRILVNRATLRFNNFVLG